MKWNDEGVGGAISKLAVMGIVGGATALGMGIFYGGCFEYVKPHELAVKESKYGSGVDYSATYEGGKVYFSAPGVFFHSFPRGWQTLDYSDNKADEGLEGKIEGYRHAPAVDVQSGGFHNFFDVTVLYRIKDAQLIVKNLGLGGISLDYVRTKVDPALRKAFGAMKPEDFYNPEARLAAIAAAQTALHDILKPDGMEVGEVLIRAFRYNEQYEKEIHRKVLQHQLEIANKAGGDAAKIEAMVKKVIAEGQAAVNTEGKRAEGEVTKITAEAENYRRIKDAEGAALVKKAEAEGQRLVNAAYEGAGSERMMGVEMAGNTARAIKRVYVKGCKQGGANPLDLNAMLRNFTAGGLQ